MKRGCVHFTRLSLLTAVTLITMCKVAFADNCYRLDELSEMRLWLTGILAILIVLILGIDKIHQKKKDKFKHK